MINGNSVIFQVGKESTYGTTPAMTNQIKITSESVKPVFNKKDEGVFTGGRGNSAKSTMSKKTEGAFSMLGRPDDIGLILLGLFGVEGDVEQVEDTDAYIHTFTALGTSLSDSLPSLSVVIDRKAGIFAYNGLKIDSVSFSAEPEDYLKLDVNVVGREEKTGTLTTLTPSVLRAFRFKGGKVFCDSVEIASVSSIKFEYKNNLDTSTQTTATGDYFEEAQPGTREITITIEMLYSASAETIRNAFLKTDNTCTLEIEFTSEEEADENVPYSFKLIAPVCQADTIEANAGGKETIKQSATFNVVDTLVGEFITAELVNARVTKY